MLMLLLLCAYVCVKEREREIVCIYVYACMHIMEYGDTPYVGLTLKKHDCHTLAQDYFTQTLTMQYS